MTNNSVQQIVQMLSQSTVLIKVKKFQEGSAPVGLLHGMLILDTAKLVIDIVLVRSTGN